MAEAIIVAVLGVLTGVIAVTLIAWTVPSFREYMGLRPLLKRYVDGSDMREAVFWWTYRKGYYWGIGVCLELPWVYWSWRFAYKTRYHSHRWVSGVETFPRD